MKITITDKCDRCKREAPREIDSAEIPALEAADAKRAEALKAIEEFFASAPEGAPDLIVIFNGKVKTIGKVCDAFCTKTVQNQIDAMFREIDPSKKRKPRKPAEDKDAADTKDAKSGGNGSKKSTDQKTGAKGGTSKSTPASSSKTA